MGPVLDFSQFNPAADRSEAVEDIPPRPDEPAPAEAIPDEGAIETSQSNVAPDSPDPEVRFRLSSRHLILASPYF